MYCSFSIDSAPPNRIVLIFPGDNECGRDGSHSINVVSTGVIVTHNDNGRPVDVGRGGVSDMPVPRHFADVDAGVIVDFGRGGVSAIPVPHHFADIDMGVEDSVEVCH